MRKQWVGTEEEQWELGRVENALWSKTPQSLLRFLLF